MFSRPAKADTSIIKVLSGKWKFVINPSTDLNLYPGYMKISVNPEKALTLPDSSAHASSARQDVVPTAMTRPVPDFARFTFRAVSSGIVK